MTAINYRYALEEASNIILKHKFKRIALQFPDNELAYSVSTYWFLEQCLVGNEIELFIIGDSTWGSSIDDISAMHYDGDLLIYFGSDLSASSKTIPVLILSPRKNIIRSNFDSILSELASNEKIVIMYELCYYWSITDLMISSNIVPSIVMAHLPHTANLETWSPKPPSLEEISNTDNSFESVGGLLIDKLLIDNHNLPILYIGDKQEQLVNIYLKLSKHKITHYSPQNNTTTNLLGEKSKEFQERYGGVSKVIESKIIGIIVGSMGLDGEQTKRALDRITDMISAAGKKHYVFVMGRLNEAKLCNFPEVTVNLEIHLHGDNLVCFAQVNLYVLISNEDQAIIKPKTFHVAVITPYELEVGLGAQEWSSSYSTGLGYMLHEDEQELNHRIDLVKQSYPIESDSELEANLNELENINLSSTIISDQDMDRNPVESSLIKENSSDLVSKVQLTDAMDYYQSRSFQGLVPTVSNMMDLTIKPGLHGIATNYSQLPIESLSSKISSVELITDS